MLSSSIKSEIKKLWDKFWSGGISNPLTAIEQISYLLFMRRLDEVDLNNIKKAEFSGEKYKSVFKGHFQVPNLNEDVDKGTLRWSHFKQMEGGEMLAHVQSKVFPFIKQLNVLQTPLFLYMEASLLLAGI